MFFEYLRFGRRDRVRTSSKSKITYLHDHVFGEEHVTKLEIAVNDLLRVDVLHSLDELPHEITDFGFRQRDSVLQDVNQALKKFSQVL